MKGIHIIAFILLIIGGLNWLLFGIWGWEIGQLFGGNTALVSRIIYILIGLAALFELFSHKATCKMCKGADKPKPTPEMPT